MHSPIVSRGLAIAAVLWSVGVAWWIWVTPVRSVGMATWVANGGTATTSPIENVRRFSELSLLGVVPLIIPVALAPLAAWGAWRGRPASMFVITVVLLAYCFVTGFSIGRGFVPAVVLLMCGAVAALDGSATRGPAA